MTTLPVLRRPLLDALAAPFRLLGEALMALALAGPRVEALERLGHLSDEQLAARGTTRVAQVERILGVRSRI
jgi:hypothetical protein